MNPLKKLVSQTAVYGLSSIIGRLLNYILVPFIVSFFGPDEYGVVTELYAYVAFFAVVLTFGMETTFFKFASDVKTKEERTKLFNQGLSILGIFNASFLLIGIGTSSFIADSLGYADQTYFVICLVSVIFMDAISSLPLAKLRQEDKAKKFALIQLSSIGVNIILTLIFIGLGKGTETFSWLYSEKIGIGYIFIINVLSSFIKPVLLWKEIKSYRFEWDKTLAAKMFRYATPLMIGGFAYVINEVLDRAILKHVLMSMGRTQKEALTQVGIYGACYKLSILMNLCIQAFRYAGEPFFFSQAKSENRDKMYAKVMNYFVAFLSILFLVVTLYMDFFKFFIPNEAYWEGLKIVPILLLAYMFLGIYTNQSIWYKLSGQTKFGAYISVVGAIVTLVLNFALIPFFGYVGSAWVTLIVYAGMCIGSYFLGQKHYPIRYQKRKVLTYIGSSVLIFFIYKLVPFEGIGLYIFNGILIIGFIGLFVFIERPNLSGLKGLLKRK
jgi:O-antigen/teichoic acid export membrane protein